MIEYLNNCIEIDDTDDSLILELDDNSHARFGEIYGDVEDQQNLVDYIDTHGGKIDIIEVNGEPQEIGENKEVNIRVPVYVSDLENDSNFVSDANYVHTDNNFTDLEKAKLEAIDPEDLGKVDDVYQNGVSVLGTDKIARVTVPTNVSDLTNDSGYITSAALSGYATETYVNNHHDTTKQDTISDLTTIRSGASKGNTAVQPADIADMASKTWVEGKGYITGIDSGDVVEALGFTPYNNTNPSGFQTASQVNTTITSKDYATNTRVNEVEAEIPEVVDNLTSSDSDKALSAKQGKALDDKIDDIPVVSVSATGSSTTKAKYITVDGNEYNISSEDAAWGNITGTLSNQQDLNGALSTKADLVNGRIPIQQMPEFVVADVVEVETYEDLPAQGQSNTLYHVILTDTTYRWVGNHYLQISQQAQYYSLLIDTNISTMGQLKAAVDSVNNAGDHVFFDLHQLVNEGYVCTVHFWSETVSGVTKNYCEINDILNDRMYGVGQEWTTSQLVSNYCSAQNTLYDIKKLTINGTVATNNKGVATVTIAIPVSDVKFKNSTVVQNGIAIIPETLASFTADSTHRTVSDTEKTTWNNKLSQSDLNGYATETYVDNHHDSTKQDTITDLASIRTGAGKGNTAVQPADISDMATQTWVEGKDYATNTRVDQVENGIPTKTSDLTNDSGYITSSALTGYATETYVDNHHDSTKQNTLVSGTNIKTVNGQSVLGSGNLAISGLIYDESTDPSTGLVNADRLNNHPDSYFQTAISDLNDIRSGATAGSTALQPDDNISELTNDAGYLTLSTLPIWDGSIE